MANEKTEIMLDSIGMVYKDQGGNDVTALTNVTLDIKKGESISLLGPSGCGKTTLLRIIADLLHPTSGTITVGGVTPREARLAQRYGIVFQSPVLYDWRTVRRNVMLPLEIMHVPKGEREDIADGMLEMVGLTNFANHYPNQLSGGMQQRVGIARALAIRPEILLMDEPFASLDFISRGELQAELLDIQKELQKTILLVTHQLDEALLLAQRIVVLHADSSVRVWELELPYPRDLTSPQLAALREEVTAECRKD